MKNSSFKKAYYIKLGKNGEWEDKSIGTKRIRIGWPDQSLSDINNENWSKIKEELVLPSSKKGVGTRDYNALRLFCESTNEDIWITFYASKLWWTRVGEKKIFEDSISKYRHTFENGWSDEDCDGKTLFINRISGIISKLQGFRGTICRVEELDNLYRLLNNEPSIEYNKISNSKTELVDHIVRGLKHLHWKDFETLVDLLFRNAGWRRISLVGETMKSVDMELEEPITKDLYQVQVKSQASANDLKNYIKSFSSKNFRKLYFVVHSPDESLKKYVVRGKNIELMLPEQLAIMVLNLGLLDWLMSKIK